MDEDLLNWNGCARPSHICLKGQSVRLETYDEGVHAKALWTALGGLEGANQLMRYFPNDRFCDADDFARWLTPENQKGNYQTMIFIDQQTGHIVGMASYMNIDAQNGVIEVGAVAHGAQMARSTMATEGHYLMAKYVFETLKYRRYEWKLNNENQPSHKAAQRLGFRFEGVFKKHMVAKGKNRDTAWYAMTNDEWPVVKAGFEAWLSPDNFKDGQQIKRLEAKRLESSGQ